MKSKNNTTISEVYDEMNAETVLNACEMLSLNDEQFEAVKEQITLFFNVADVEECILCYLTGRELI